MGTFLLTILVALFIALCVFNPYIDHVELRNGENWVIVWYNHYYIFRGKIKHNREWIPLYPFKRYD